MRIQLKGSDNQSNLAYAIVQTRLHFSRKNYFDFVYFSSKARFCYHHPIVLYGKNLSGLYLLTSSH